MTHGEYSARRVHLPSRFLKHSADVHTIRINNEWVPERIFRKPSRIGCFRVYQALQKPYTHYRVQSLPPHAEFLFLVHMNKQLTVCLSLGVLRCVLRRGFVPCHMFIMQKQRDTNLPLLPDQSNRILAFPSFHVRASPFESLFPVLAKVHVGPVELCKASVSDILDLLDDAM